LPKWPWMFLRTLLTVALLVAAAAPGRAAAAPCVPAPGDAAFNYRAGAPAKLGAMLVRPNPAGGPLRGAGILWVHWLGDPATTNHTEFAADARALAARGATSVLVDAMWSQPHWFEAGRSPATDACDVARQVIALRRALDVLGAQPGVDPQRIAYVGHDFGAMYGSLLLAVDPRPSRAVLMTPALTFWEWFLLGKAPADARAYVATMSRYDLPGWLARTHARATLLQFAQDDGYVSGAAAAAFRNAVPARGRTYVTYAGDHALTVAAATNDRRAWLLRELAK
jgi:dienelactone hydrolase